jgi:hypothetical protein
MNVFAKLFILLRLVCEPFAQILIHSMYETSDVPVSNDKLREDYGGMNDHASSSGSQKSLFSALEHTQVWAIA